MGYRVVVTAKAARDLREIYRHIASDNPMAAHRLRLKLIAQLKFTQNFIQLGRTVPEMKNPRIRELVRNPYRIIYRIQDEESVIQVLRFWHAARGTPKI